MKSSVILFVLSMCLSVASAQKRPLAITFQKAEKQGLTIGKLDSIYKSAVDTNPEKAVFVSPEAQKSLMLAYTTLLQDLGKYLHEHNFKWEHPTKCFNRIYFQPNGRIDYFLYNFIQKPADVKISDEKRAAFDELLNAFVKDYQFKLSAPVKFAQCSPVTYTD